MSARTRAAAGLALTATLALAAPLVPTLSNAALAPAAALPSGAAGPQDAEFFHRTATYPVHLNLPADVAQSSETVAEISAVAQDGNTLAYTDALGKRIGFLDITDPGQPRGLGSLSLATLGHADDQPTSVAVHGDHVLVVVDTSGGDFAHPSGRLDVVRISDNRRVASIDLGGQPDSIAISKDGAYAAIAMENQRDEEFRPDGAAKGDLPQAPAGFVQTLRLDGAPSTWQAVPVPLTQPDGSALPSFEAAGLDTPQDPEPEYVSVNDAGVLAVTLQENNGIALVDLATRRVTKVFSAGTASVSGIDTKKDGRIDLTGSISDVPREPDAIGWVDDRYVATANEGDWKGGTQGWTVFDTTTGEVVWDAGASFADEIVRLGLHNEDRAAKKGAEPEGLSLGTFGGVRYAFVGSERSNAVLVYDMTDPRSPRYVQALPTTNGPEGLLPIESRDMLVVSSETDAAAAGVRASVSLFERGPGTPAFPSIASADVAGKPVGWTALGALTAHPTRPGTLYAASDAALSEARVYTVDRTRKPALITEARTVTVDGAPAAVDVEGISARPDGGFWLAVEGATGAGNTILRTDADLAVVETVTLPTEVTQRINKWGLEGITSVSDADGEHLYVALQRPLWADGKSPDETFEPNAARIGRYDVADGSWHWYRYPLDQPLRDGSDWVGLSEIVAVDSDTLAVVERDKLNGPKARIKRIQTVDLPAGDPAGVPLLRKRLAHDVLPDLRATHGWTQEKLEGLTIAADGQVYAVTDNDGLKDATGETVFLRLGAATQVFDAELATRTRLDVPRSAKVGQRVTFTAHVTGSGAALNGGTVTFRDGRTVLGRATVRDGRATLTVTSADAGRRTLSAEYSGTARSGASRSSATLQVARGTATVSAKAPAKVTLTKAQKRRGSVNVRTAVTVRTEGVQPSGKVRITSKGRTLATVKLVKGRATATVTLKGRRLHTLTFRYLGDTSLAPSSTKVRVRVR